MLVSAISSSSCKSLSNLRINSRGGENCTELALNDLSSISTNNQSENKSKIFDSINEWKYFCHAQIEKGNLDVIV